MIREHVVITPISIKKAGQVKHFQVKLPKNTKSIIGVELGGRWLPESKDVIIALPKEATAQAAPESSATPTKEAIKVAYNVRATEWSKANFFKRNTLIGEIKLQSCEEANIFYSGHLQLDNNIGYGDFSQSRNWIAAAFTHQANSFEERVVVDGESTIVQGVYKDRFGELNKIIINYLVNVYVWIEIEEPKINNK